MANKEERVLVLIKPDAMAKKLFGIILYDLSQLDIKMIGLKLVNVQRELAEQHYSEHRGKPFFEDLIKYIQGEFHERKKVLAMVKSKRKLSL